MTKTKRTTVVDPARVTPRTGSSYPAPFDAPCAIRRKQALGDPGGLTSFGVNLLTLPPGSWSAQRHWHTKEDEFVYVLEGEVTLVTDDGEFALRSGMAAAFPAGEANGHHLINRSEAEARVLEVGTRPTGDVVSYPDIDLEARKEGGTFAFYRKTGEPY